MPIAYGLICSGRIKTGVALLDLATMGALALEAPDLRRFPCLASASKTLRAGGMASAALNTASEVVIKVLLQRCIRFTKIAAVMTDTLVRTSVVPADSLDTVFATDAQARQQAKRHISIVRIQLPVA